MPSEDSSSRYYMSLQLFLNNIVDCCDLDFLSSSSLSREKDGNNELFIFDRERATRNKIKQ